ncbi:MAG: AarF/UbiB family protein [Actinomycetota bacterium]|nr:AarF/UbiB family protein [Actinomycetota bacterium]
MNSETGSEGTFDDSKVGSFSEVGPWKVDPDKLLWLPQVESLRQRNADSIPRLIKRQLLPPGARVVKVGWHLGKALLMWRIFERPQGNPTSREGLSKRLKVAFEILGPTYVKLGQIISSGEGIFPPELVTEFKELRDKVTPEPFDRVRRTIEQDLGATIEEVFSNFNPVAIASASIAQVYLATLRTGEEVVVKVQRSTVSEFVKRDLAAMAWFSPALVGRIPVAALANPPALVDLFAETIVEELDFRLEAANMLDIARILAETEQRSIVVPRPHPRYVTKRVMVMQRLKGFSWDDAEGMRNAGIDTSKVLRAALVAFMEGAVLYGVFHGDLHGGNLMVQEDGKVALLDYGITGRLGEFKRLAFLRLLLGGTINDIKMQTSALRDLGALPQDTDIEAVISDLGLDKPAKDPTTMTPDELTKEIRELTKALLGYGARLPKELMLFIKNMIFLDASLARLAPDVDLFAEIMFLATYFTNKHGARIAAEVGIDPRERAVDLDGVRGSLGLDAETEAITYRELRQRRETIRTRMEENAKRNSRRAENRTALSRVTKTTSKALRSAAGAAQKLAKR